MVALDATNSSSPGLKLLRSYLNNTRMEFFKVTRFIFSVKLYIYHTSSIILEEMLSHHLSMQKLRLQNNLEFGKFF